MDAMAAIRETFFQECEEQLGELEAGLTAMEEGAGDDDIVNAVFRAVHSIKGGAGAFGLDGLVHFAHGFETTLDCVRGGTLAPSTTVVKALVRAADVLADLVAAARAGAPLEDARAEAFLDELRSLAEGASAATREPDAPDFEPLTFSLDDFGAETAAPAERGFAIAFRPQAAMFRNGGEPARLLRELAALGDACVVCDCDALPSLDRIDAAEAYLAWQIDLRTEAGEPEVREIFDFVIDDCALEIIEIASPDEGEGETTVEAAAPAVEQELAGGAGEKPADERAAVRSEPASATIRVDLERVDRLVNLVGELVIHQAMLSQRVVEAGLARSSNVAAGLGALEQLTREIQEGVMATRAQPVKPLFQRMARIVREVADATGKSVRLRTEGEATEVDRTVIERLADPLTHMVRNAIDHGLESADRRIAAGKTEQGEVRLSAAHRSGRIVIEVADDGGGVNRARVRQIAIEKELIAADAPLTDNEIDNLLFMPGFSTAEKVSSISGRGVGMDVVKRSIQALGGRISISSRPGVGSTFTMSLPLTLAVLDGMVVRVAGQTLVVPLTTIAETLRPKKSDVHWLGPHARVTIDRDGLVPLIDVGCQLGYRAAQVDPLTSVVLIVETEVSTRCALIVDEILDQRQVVIKSLEANYRRVPGIAAATILGDGRVALILDIDTFVASAAGGAATRLSAAAG